MSEQEGKIQAIDALFSLFESLGNNCEFGIVQRRVGFDPPGLFRNVGFLDIEQIIRAIYSDFEGMFEIGAYDFSLPDGWTDWRLDCLVFGFGFHSTIPAGLKRDTDEWNSSVNRIMKLFRYLRDSIREVLKDGEKIFVFRSRQEISDRTAARLLSSIRMHGDCGLLLVRESSSMPSGSVEFASDGLIFGYVHRLSNENPPVIDFQAWESMAKKILNSKEKIWIEPSRNRLSEQNRDSLAPSLAPQDFDSTLCHLIDPKNPKSNMLFSMEYEGLNGGQQITMAAWIYLPIKLETGNFGLVFIGYRTEKFVRPDTSKLLRWQRISVTATIPESQTRAVFKFTAEDVPPCRIYTGGWTMRLKNQPSGMNGA